MKKNELERRLQRVAPHTRPRPDLEQYSTPAVVAADMLFTAFSFGDIGGREVVDLGCGSGILAIGAALLGATRVTGIEVDPEAVGDAQRNIAEAGVEVEVIEEDVGRADLRADTVIMNPPFGAQRRNADRPFLEAAVRIAPRVYSLHNARTVGFLHTMVAAMDAEVFFQKSYKFEIPHMFEFHDRKKKEIEVALLCIRSLDVTK
ncbi:MAG: 50S ribosomal protein L11 methyltransferase [Methanomassiliicoccus sp.]|nr:50S ribosomal protein L11 methyltransferase [Methanomassiliicoccus sp.]